MASYDEESDSDRPNPRCFKVTTSIKAGVPGLRGPVLTVRIQEQQVGFSEYFEAPGSFSVDLQAVPALVAALDRVWLKADKAKLLNWNADTGCEDQGGDHE